MSRITFSHLADHLRHGREIEFAYRDRRYSVTNHTGFWYLRDDTDHRLLDTLCPFGEKELLVSRLAAFQLEGVTVAEIFDRQLYDADRLHII